MMEKLKNNALSVCVCYVFIVAVVYSLSSCTSRSFIVKSYTGEDIQAAIDKVYSKGGGKVVVPPGEYRVGSIQLRSNVELHLEKGAHLIGSDKSEDYYSFPLDICSIRPEESSKVLLYAYDAHNITVSGEGIIDGQGPAFFDKKLVKGYYSKPPVERPRMVQFVRCEGIHLSGVTFKDSPCWTMLIRLCKNIEVKGISIIADQRMINNDGIDFDGCSHVRVSDSRFKTCDDCIVLRAMREYPEQKVVCEDIIVENCQLDSRCQTVRLGCPSDDIIRNATFRNIEAVGNNGIFADFPRRYLDEDEGYMDLSNIVFDKYRGSFTGSVVQIVSEPGIKTRRVDDIVFRNFDVRSARPLRFIGNPGHEIGHVLLENFCAEVEKSGSPYIIKGCDSLIFKNVRFNGKIFPDGRVNKY